MPPSMKLTPRGVRGTTPRSSRIAAAEEPQLIEPSGEGYNASSEPMTTAIAKLPSQDEASTPSALLQKDLANDEGNDPTSLSVSSAEQAIDNRKRRLSVTQPDLKEGAQATQEAFTALFRYACSLSPWHRADMFAIHYTRGRHTD